MTKIRNADDSYQFGFSFQALYYKVIYLFKFNRQVDHNKTQFLHLSPVLASSDVARDIQWYEQKLGFKNVFDSTR